MPFQTTLNCTFIFIGAIIMLISIFKTRILFNAMSFVPEHQRSQIIRFMLLHRGLMIFFLIGYIVVFYAFMFKVSFVSETFVSLIFMFGAVFVFIGIMFQSGLLLEMQNTLNGILPICSRCKKIRINNENQKDPKSWKGIEEFIAERAAVDFSHGYCPDCYDQERQKIRKFSGLKRKNP